VRIALITSRFPFHPAAESFLYDEILELARRFDVIIVPAIFDGFRTSYPSVDRIAAPPLRLFEPRVLRAALAEVLRSPRRAATAFFSIVSKPRSAIAKLRNAAMFPKALAVARLLRDWRIDHVHAYWLSAPATIAYVVSLLNAIEWSATGHRYDLVDYNLTTVGKPNPGFIPTAGFVRVISKKGRDHVDSALGQKGKYVNVVHLGVRLPQRAARPSRARGSLKLICAGGLVPVKDHPTLLRAVAAARTAGVAVQCTMAGDGPERNRLESLAEELGMAGVVLFEGALPHDELLHRIRRGDYDVAILTSVDRGLQLCEGIPVSLLEAMAAGLPCIATASGSISELVTELNGMLCSPGDVGALARAIGAMAANPQLRIRLGEASRATVEAAFDVAETSQQLAALLAGPWGDMNRIPGDLRERTPS
jgi:colanic acid/amylovoran biosynthesis glycosyltransferase